MMNAELMAVLGEGEGRSQQLEATLQEKESQLSQLTELQKVGSSAPPRLPVLHGCLPRSSYTWMRSAG